MHAESSLLIRTPKPGYKPNSDLNPNPAMSNCYIEALQSTNTTAGQCSNVHGMMEVVPLLLCSY